MAYIGKQLVRGQNRKLDDISSSFNGATTTFNLTVDGDSVTPGTALQLFISIGGVLQNPNTDFTVAGNQITFSTAPGSGLSFFGYLQGDAVDFNTPADGSVTTAKLSSNLSINADKLQFTQSGTGAVTRTVESKLQDVVSVLDFIPENEHAAIKDGTSTYNCTSNVQQAYAYAKTTGGELYFPAGTYLGQFLFDGEAPVKGAGIRRTVLKPSSTTYCVRLYGSAGYSNLGATLSNLSIKTTGKVGVGLELGNIAFPNLGCSNALIERLEISGFEKNIKVSMSTMTTLRQVDSSGGTYGINFDQERNVTTTHFDTCRFRSNDYGIYSGSGTNVTWTSCNSESNTFYNLRLYTGLTSGPHNWSFNNCWFEDVQPGSGTRASVILDMEPSIAATKATNTEFNRCVVTSAVGVPDILAERAQNVVFNYCSFSPAVAGSLVASKFQYNSVSNAVKVRLFNCGTVQLLPSATLYANFPSLTTNGNGTFGFFYQFTNEFNETISNNNAVPSYVSGNFTPVLEGTTSAGTGTYSTRTGIYTKIGNVVHFTLYLNWTAHTGTGNMQITGLPFAPNVVTAVSHYADSITLTAGKILYLRIDNGSTSIQLRQTLTGSIAQFPVAMDTSGSLAISGSYLTA